MALFGFNVTYIEPFTPISTAPKSITSENENGTSKDPSPTSTEHGRIAFVKPNIGDHIFSDSTSYVATNPFGRCKYCNNLSLPSARQHNVFRGAKLAVADFVSGHRPEPCIWCKVLAGLVDLYEPQAAEMVEYSPGTAMYLYISGQNVMTLHTPTTDGFIIQQRWTFQLYRAPGTAALPPELGLPTCPELALIPGQEPMWDFLRQCLMTCLYGHEECRAAQKVGWLPRRLIFMENNSNYSPNLRLVMSDEIKSPMPYIALSHCWGIEQPHRLLKDNADDLCLSITIENLSRVFRDAITTAQKFGIKYLWIDSLCIMQDDATDLDTQIAQMDQIYENAIFVVAATASVNGTVPFLGPDAPSKRNSTHKTVELEMEGGSTFQLRARSFKNHGPSLAYEKREGPLRGRAWAWQEDILSTRIIHFTEKQAMWQCVQSSGLEIMGDTRPRENTMRRDMLDPNKRLYEWQHMVRDYAGLALTDKHDRLPALAGVAQRFKTLLDDEYIAGMWRRPLLVDLCWEHARALNNMTNPLETTRDFGCPSWSWASLDGNIHFDAMYRPTAIEIKYDVTGIDCKPASSINPQGRVHKGSSLRLAGRVTPAVLVHDEWGFAVVLRARQEPQLVLLDARPVPINLSEEGEDEDEFVSFRRATADDPPFHSFVGDGAAVPDSSEGYLALKAEAKNNLVAGNALIMLCHQRIPMNADMEEKGEQHAIVMVLAQISKEPEVYQRIGLGRGGEDLNSERVVDAITWRWTTFETWEKWEDWFEGAEHREVVVI